MNTRNKFSKILFLVVSFCGFGLEHSFASEADSLKTSAGEYSLVLYVGGGWSYYAITPAVSSDYSSEASRSGFAGTLRVMWHPDHFLRLGLETGMVPFYSYEIKSPTSSGELKLSATPIMIEWSMPITKKINVFAGYGLYLLKSELDYGQQTNNSSNSLGFLLAANYIHPINDHLGIAGELKWMNATETENAVFSVQAQFVWKFLKW